MKIFENIKEYALEDNEELDFLSQDFHIARFRDLKKINNDALGEKEYAIPHKRGFFEISLIIRNSELLNIGEKSYKNIRNSLVIVSPFQMFSLDISTKYSKELPISGKSNGYVIFFKPTFFNSIKQPQEIQSEFPFFRIHSAPLYTLSEEDIAKVVQLMEQIYTESKNIKMNSAEVVRSYLLILLYQIKRITHGNTSFVTVNRFDAITARFEQTIISNNGTFFLVSEYASKMNISSIYLSECVKKATGKSAQKVIIDYKILYAQSLLHQLNKSISEIAAEMGFEDVSNFTKFFKRSTGLTPNQYRKEKS